MVERDELDRVMRAKTHADMRRTTAIASIRAVHELVMRARSEPIVVPTLLANMADLDVFRSQFRTEDDAVLECLIDSGQQADYSHDLPPQVRALINECRSVSDQLSPSGPNIMK